MSVSAEVQRERDDAAGVEGVVLVREVITGSSVMVCVCVCEMSARVQGHHSAQWI